MDALILAGGKGTRLSTVVPDLPKPLAPVNGRPFLDHVIAQLERSSVISRVLLSVGHLSQKIIDHYTRNPPRLPIAFVPEGVPLGTGGAILHALVPEIRSPDFFVLNGDSLVKTDFDRMASVHSERALTATLLLVHVPDTGRYGKVVEKNGRVIRFEEKDPDAGAGIINAGTYVFNRQKLERFPNQACSLERDILPVLASEGQVGALLSPGPFLDMGVPESYAEAPRFLHDFKYD